MKDLTITIIQSELYWENVDANLDKLSKKISSIKESTDLIILPEMFSTGFTMNAKSCAEEMNGKTIDWLHSKAKEKNCVITGSVIISEQGKFYNRLIWMKPDGAFLTYDKRHLFRLADEHKTYSPGNKKIIPEINGWKICPLICYDLRFPVWSRRTKKEDYDLLLYVANWPDRRIHAWRQLLAARAIENQCYVAGVNRIGNDGNEIHHSGYSAVIDFKGDQMSKTNPNEESVETISLHKESLIDFRKHFPFADDADEFSLVS
jgi:omega-amidase